MIYQTISLSLHAFNVACPTCGIQLPVNFSIQFILYALVFLKCVGKGSFAATNLFWENNDSVALYKTNMKSKCLAGLVRRVKVRQLMKIEQPCLSLFCILVVLMLPQFLF